MGKPKARGRTRKASVKAADLGDDISEQSMPPISRKEAERLVREGPELRCRGPNREQLTPREYANLPETVQNALGRLPKLKAGEDARSPREMVVALAERGALAEARVLDDITRAGCGFDFRTIVATGKLDGSRQEYVCPECGVRGIYFAPVFNVVKDRE
jgi:hypothetical protein